MTLEDARTKIFTKLRRCPACGGELADNETILGFQRAEFLCGAILTRQQGSMPVVNSPCPAPSNVAVRHLERQAETMVSQVPI